MTKATLVWERKLSSKKEWSTSSKNFLITTTTSLQSKETARWRLIRKLTPNKNVFIYSALRLKIMAKGLTQFNNCLVTKKRLSLNVWGRQLMRMEFSKIKNTNWISLMVNSAILKIKMSNIRTLKVNYSRPTSTNIFRARKTSWSNKNALSLSKSANKTKSLSAMKSIDLKVIRSRCTKTRLICRLKLRPWISIWLISIIKTIACKKNSKALLRLMTTWEKG